MPDFKQIWVLSMPFVREDGENPVSICLVASEFYSGEVGTLNNDQLIANVPPFDVGSDSLILTVSANEILGCILEIGWPLPAKVLDLGVESRWLRNGQIDKDDCSLSAAMNYHDITGFVDDRSFAKKSADISDGKIEVVAMTNLYSKIKNSIDWPRALFRGRYLAALAIIERNGIPIDVGNINSLWQNGDSIVKSVVDEIDSEFHVCKNYKFNKFLFGKYLIDNNIQWPQKDGSLDVNDEAFKLMSFYPNISRIRELRKFLINMNQRVLSFRLNQKPGVISQAVPDIYLEIVSLCVVLLNRLKVVVWHILIGVSRNLVLPQFCLMMKK